MAKSTPKILLRGTLPPRPESIDTPNYLRAYAFYLQRYHPCIAAILAHEYPNLRLQYPERET
jgi:hypothetical protein